MKRLYKQVGQSVVLHTSARAGWKYLSPSPNTLVTNPETLKAQLFHSSFTRSK
jgi:hypothetical protein